MTMNVNDFFKGEYLKAGDLDDDMQVTIKTIKPVAMGGDDDEEKAQVKPVLYFNGLEKGLVCNKTNSMTIAAVLGMDMEQWIGKDIVLYSTTVDFKGSSVPGIRVRMPKEVRVVS